MRRSKNETDTAAPQRPEFNTCALVDAVTQEHAHNAREITQLHSQRNGFQKASLCLCVSTEEPDPELFVWKKKWLNFGSRYTFQALPIRVPSRTKTGSPQEMSQRTTFFLRAQHKSFKKKKKLWGTFWLDCDLVVT